MPYLRAFPTRLAGALLLLAPLLAACSDPARALQQEVEVKVQEAVNFYRAGDAQASGMAWKEAMTRFREYTWDPALNRPLDHRLQEKAGDLTLDGWRKEWEDRMSTAAGERWDVLLTAVEEGRIPVEEVESLWLPLDRRHRLAELWTPYRAELAAQGNVLPKAAPELTPEQLQEQERTLAGTAIRLDCIIQDLPGEQDQIIDQLLCGAVAEALQAKTGDRDLIPESTAPESDFLGVIHVTGKLAWNDYPGGEIPYRIPKGIVLDIQAQRKGQPLAWGGVGLAATQLPPPAALPAGTDLQGFLTLRNTHVEQMAAAMTPKLAALPPLPP